MFDGLRALAALSVLLFHASLYTNAVRGGGVSPYLARLNVGVAVFFVISGFLLYRPMLAARADGQAGRPVREYACRRFLRIVPAYWVALTVLTLWPGLPDVASSHWWIYYGFSQGTSYATASNGIGPAWTLGCELVFYLLLPVFSAAADRAARPKGARIRPRLELLVLAGLSAASLLYGMRAAGHPAPPLTTPMATFGWFALGMMLALASVSRDHAAVKLLMRYAWIGWPIAALAYLTMCRGLGLGQQFGYAAANNAFQFAGIYVLSGVVAFGLVLPATAPRNARSAIGRVLSSRVLAWLGLVSYGIYLYHGPLLTMLNRLAPGSSAPTKMLWLLPLGIAISAAAGAASYYLVERPALRLARRIGVARRQRGPGLESLSASALRAIPGKAGTDRILPPIARERT